MKFEGHGLLLLEILLLLIFPKAWIIHVHGSKGVLARNFALQNHFKDFIHVEVDEV